MKKEWKPEELRQTSEEIRGATLAKSITPEMIGGTLSGLTEALAEVVDVLGEIPREHVTVKVRGYDGTAGVSGAGATVWLDVFNTKGYPCVAFARQELTCDENGVVEFDVPHGFKYAVFSQIAGLGASFQIVNTANSESRGIHLWNLPIGINILYYCAIWQEDDTYRVAPYVTDTVITEWTDEESAALSWDITPDTEEYQEDSGILGVLVSTAETSFVLTPDSLSKERMTWCSNRDFGTLIGCMPQINNVGTDETWEDCQNRARADYDGNMNTAKILDFCHEATAANFCANKSPWTWDEQSFLPSAGQAYIMWLNRTAINSAMQQLIDANEDSYQLLPYENEKGQWQYPNGSYEYWWTSTIYDLTCSWVVRYSGYVSDNDSGNPNDVRAVSAFHFEY